MEDLPQFGVQHVKGVPVVEVRGDLDLTNVGQFETTLEKAARTDGRTVVVSLTHTRYFDSKGVHALLRSAERLAANRQRFLLVAPRGGSPRRILEIAGVPRSIPTFESVEDALNHSEDGEAR